MHFRYKEADGSFLNIKNDISLRTLVSGVIRDSDSAKLSVHVEGAGDDDAR